MQPRVHLDEHRDVAPELLAHAPDAFGDLHGVQAHAHLRALEQLPESLQLPFTNEGERDQEVVEPGVGHDLGLPELRDGDAGRSGVHLHPGDLGGLVGLRVRPEPDARRSGDRSHLGDVALERVEVDHQRRRVQDVEVHAHPFGCPFGR